MEGQLPKGELFATQTTCPIAQRECIIQAYDYIGDRSLVELPGPVTA